MGFGHQQGGPDEHQRYAEFDHVPLTAILRLATAGRAGHPARAAIWRATMAASSPTPFKSDDLRLRRKWTPTK